MKNILRMALVVIVMAGLGVAKAGAVDQPTVKIAYDQKGNPVAFGYAPVKHKYITVVSETLVTGNSALLMGVIMSSVNPTTNDFLTFRDTNTADGSGAIAINKLMFPSTSSASGYDNMVYLPHPIQFGKGITVGANGGAAFSILGTAYTVLYLENR